MKGNTVDTTATYSLSLTLDELEVLGYLVVRAQGYIKPVPKVPDFIQVLESIVTKLEEI